jgi:hypothetical protein
MTRFSAIVLAAAIATTPVAAFAQGTANQAQPATKMPSAGDAGSGSSGGGNTGVNTTGSTTRDTNCQQVRMDPTKYSKDVVANCK